MKEQFVTYQIAEKLKELGFDEECLAVYPGDSEMKFVLLNKNRFINDKSSWVTAPLWQQAIDWFWDNHKILITQFWVSDQVNTIMWLVQDIKEIDRYHYNKIDAFERAFELINNKK